MRGVKYRAIKNVLRLEVTYQQKNKCPVIGINQINRYNN